MGLRYSDYDAFAWLYEKHWGDRFLPAALVALEKLALYRIPADASILDLCCGTGQLAEALTERGYRVMGVDGSEEMLRYARRRARRVEFILEDARTFTSPASYHLVTSMFDSLNHVMKKEELIAVFRNVHVALREGGLFLFDLNMEAGYRANWNGWYGIVEDDHVCVIQNSYESETQVAQFEATVFRLEGNWHRSSVILRQKCYSEAEVRSALETAGFTDVRVYGFSNQSGLTKLSEDSPRAFFLCRKD